MSEQPRTPLEADDEPPPPDPPGFRMLVILLVCFTALAVTAVVMIRRMQFGVE